MHQLVLWAAVFFSHLGLIVAADIDIQHGCFTRMMIIKGDPHFMGHLSVSANAMTIYSSIGPLGANFSGILIKTHNFSFMIMYLKM